MANLEHVDILKQGVEEVWNRWREKNPRLKPDLSDTNLENADLRKEQQLMKDRRKKVLSLIEKKIEGEEITAAPEVEAEDKIVDLMEALKASLGSSGASGSKGRKPAKRASSSGEDDGKKRAAR